MTWILYLIIILDKITVVIGSGHISGTRSSAGKKTHIVHYVSDYELLNYFLLNENGIYIPIHLSLMQTLKTPTQYHLTQREA